MSGTEMLLILGSSPVAIAVAIILATFVLEDAATVAAALLAASGLIAPPLAFAALFIGIFGGDLGLYGLGAAARTQDWARRRIGDARIERGRAWLNQHLVAALVTARCVPGLRMPAYSTSGFLGVSFKAFAAITAGASLAWTAVAFGIVYAFGAAALTVIGPWIWAVGAVFIAALICGPYLLRRFARFGV
jgi:membrane protein DedA with SNARE-associated domain